jgi:NAD(P)-dependent dehydrogenase (short-subunit alcohol dehydrogenase family)
MIRKNGGTTQVNAGFASDTVAMSQAIATLPRLEFLINNTGIAHIAQRSRHHPARPRSAQSVTASGIDHCLHFGVKRMLENGGSSIVNPTSIAAKVDIPDRFAYGMTEGSILGMTLSVARDFVDKGIRCNCICPAHVHTPFVDESIAKNDSGREGEMFAKLSATQSIGCMGSSARLAACLMRNASAAPEVSADIRLGSPIARPSKIICIGLNHRDHATESGMVEPSEPIIFFKSTTTFTGPNDGLIIPRGSEKADLGVELAVIIEKTTQYVTDEDCLTYVAD